MNKLSKRIHNVFVDMDGVLVDLLSQVQLIEPGIETLAVKNSSMDDEMWIRAWKRIEEIGAEWWANLPWFQDARALWLYLKKFEPHLYILSAAPPSHRGKIHFDAIEGKKLWVERELGKEQLLRTFIVDRENKKVFAKMHASLGLNSILIDDDPRNYEDFTEAGGMCILHVSTNSTIEELKRLES